VKNNLKTNFSNNQILKINLKTNYNFLFIIIFILIINNFLFYKLLPKFIIIVAIMH